MDQQRITAETQLQIGDVIRFPSHFAFGDAVISSIKTVPGIPIPVLTLARPFARVSAFGTVMLGFETIAAMSKSDLIACGYLKVGEGAAD